MCTALGYMHSCDAQSIWPAVVGYVHSSRIYAQQYAQDICTALLSHLQSHALHTWPLMLPTAVTGMRLRAGITHARLATRSICHGKGSLLPYSSTRSRNLHGNLPIGVGRTSLHLACCAYRCRQHGRDCLAVEFAGCDKGCWGDEAVSGW